MCDKLALLMRKVALMFSHCPMPPTEKERIARDEAAGRRICSRLARGNVSLQFGNFFTDQDLKDLRKRAMSYKFSH
jgi:hypothetical protein